MEFFQILLLVGLAGYLVWRLVKPRSDWLIGQCIAPALLVGLATVQVLVEGWRWALAPAYLLVAIIALNVAWPRPPKRMATYVAGGGLLVWSGALGLSILAALLRLPAPTGGYPVGTMAVRVSIPAEIGARLPPAVSVQVWYPAREAGRMAPYGPSDWWNRWRRRLLVSHSTQDAEPARTTEPFPLLMDMSGWLGSRTDNTILAEDLASHGFTVAAIDDVGLLLPPDHPYAQPLNLVMDFSTPEASRKTTTMFNQKAALEGRLASLVVDTLLVGRAASSFDHPRLRLDPSRVAILGWSLGGAAAAEACFDDPRFKAAVNLDGSLHGEAEVAGIPQPYLLITHSGKPPSDRGPALERYLSAAADSDKDSDQHGIVNRGGGYVLRIAGVEHREFTDDPLFSLRRITGQQRADPLRIGGTVDKYAVLFFSSILNGHPPVLVLNESPPDPGITLQTLAADGRRAP